MIICTFYSHYIRFDLITDILQKVLPGCTLKIITQDESQIAYVEIKGGFFSLSKKLKLTYRQRRTPSYQFPPADDSPLTSNLRGLYGYVSSLPAQNEKVRSLFLNKIQTLNCEFSLDQEQGEIKELKTLIETLAQEFDAVLFAQPKTLISKSSQQHFLDKNLNLIIDGSGNCEVDDVEVHIESSHFDGDQSKATEDQKERKAKSEKILEQNQIKINMHLPFVESEEETTIRSAKEIAQRVSVLAVVNLVAFNNIPPSEASRYLKKYNLWNYVTPDEKEFLANPTEDKKSRESWKCEGIWTLMWALKKVPDLGFPDALCSLDNIPTNDYPVAHDKDPNNFINSITETRSKAEILDACDLYYRLDWACVDARLTNQSITINGGVVYERHYALNWLVNYMGQDWDDVSCDT